MKEGGEEELFISKAINSLSNCSFGIYLVHKLVMKNSLF